MIILKQKTILQDTFSELACDICGKKSRKQHPKGWYQFSHSHQGWANDSLDSLESFDVCSVGCYIKGLQSSLKELKDYQDSGAEIDDKDLWFVKDLLKHLK
jgi:hypothetical protein